MDDSFRDVMGSFPPEREDRSQEVHRFDNMVLHVIDPDIFARRLDEAFDLDVRDLTLVRCNVRDAKGIVASASPTKPFVDHPRWRGPLDRLICLQHGYIAIDAPQFFLSLCRKRSP